MKLAVLAAASVLSFVQGRAQPDGGYAESMDETHSQPQFVGRLAMALLGLAVLFALVVTFAAIRGA